jgi:hypothetical protein
MESRSRPHAGGGQRFGHCIDRVIGYGDEDARRKPGHI